MTKYYDLEEIRDKYEDLSKDKKIEVLENALGLMESNNGQSYNAVIARSMGYKPSVNGKWHNDPEIIN